MSTNSQQKVMDCETEQGGKKKHDGHALTCPSTTTEKLRRQHPMVFPDVSRNTKS